MSSTYVTKIDAATAERLRARLEAEGFAFRELAHATFAAAGAGVQVVHYASGKLVVQGKGTAEFKTAHLLELLGETAPRLEVPTIGSDETGKGDYFGPLVVCAAALDPEVARFLTDVPLEDSKTLSASTIREAAETLRAVLPHEVVRIGPAKYNELHARFGSLDRLLAWAHARAIEAVLEKTDTRRVVVDRFADEAVVRRALGAAAEKLELIVRPRAEDDPAVAAAAILARDAFVRGLEQLARRVGVPLPKGAGPGVVRAGRAVLARGGEAGLAEVAKLHFKTTHAVRAPEGGSGA